VCKQVFKNAKAMYSHMRCHREPETQHDDDVMDAGPDAIVAVPNANDANRDAMNATADAMDASADAMDTDDDQIAPEGVEIDSPGRHFMDDEVLADDEVEEEEREVTGCADADHGGGAGEAAAADMATNKGLGNESLARGNVSVSLSFVTWTYTVFGIYQYFPRIYVKGIRDAQS
jgi:hypothetical protein